MLLGLRLLLELELINIAAAGGVLKGVLMKAVLHRLLAMGYLLELYLPMLEMQHLVLFVHTPH